MSLRSVNFKQAKCLENRGSTPSIQISDPVYRPHGFLDSISGMWETQDVYGDRQAEAAAKRVQRQQSDRPGPPRSIIPLGLRRGSKQERLYLVSATTGAKSNEKSYPLLWTSCEFETFVRCDEFRIIHPPWEIYRVVCRPLE